MATHWPARRERCSHGSSCLARWSVSSLMILWMPWVLLCLPWPAPAEQVGGDGKPLHGSISSLSSSSPTSLLTASSSLFNTRQSRQQLDWLLSEKGPFHRCPEYTEFRERFQQGFSTRYKIYRCVCVHLCVRARGAECTSHVIYLGKEKNLRFKQPKKQQLILCSEGV